MPRQRCLVKRHIGLTPKLLRKGEREEREIEVDTNVSCLNKQSAELGAFYNIYNNIISAFIHYFTLQDS